MNFTNANLTGANLTGALLGSADFTNANLSGANFTAAPGLGFTGVSSALYNNTICPDGVVVSSPSTCVGHGF